MLNSYDQNKTVLNIVFVKSVKTLNESVFFHLKSLTLFCVCILFEIVSLNVSLREYYR